MAKIYTSSEDNYWQESEIQVGNGTANLILTDQTAQEVLGFGGCFNELDYISMLELSEYQKLEIFDRIFGKDSEQ